MFLRNYRLFLSFLLFGALWGAVGCTPAKVRYLPGVVPEISAPTDSELHDGQQAKEYLLNKHPLNNSRAYTKRIENILERLLGVTPAEGHWRTYVVNAPIWNAMTTPGNYIYVYTGLMDALRDDGELAAVLAHEISHRLATHHEMSSGEILGKILVAAAGAGVAVAMSGDDTDDAMVRDAVGLTMSLGEGLMVNPYGQVKEYEADQIGLFLMADAGYNPLKAARVWYKRAEEGDSVPEFFSTHPASDNRYKRLMTMMEQAQVRYRAAIKNKGKRTRAKKIRVSSYVPKSQALAHYQQGYNLLQQYDYSQAEQSLRLAIGVDRSYADSWMMLGVAQAKQGQHGSSERSLKQAIRLKPHLPLAHYNLACLYALGEKNQNALRSLRKAVELDPSLKRTAQNDADLFGLRQDKGFQKIIAHAGRSTFSVN